MGAQTEDEKRRYKNTVARERICCLNPFKLSNIHLFKCMQLDNLNLFREILTHHVIYKSLKYIILTVSIEAHWSAWYISLVFVWPEALIAQLTFEPSVVTFNSAAISSCAIMDRWNTMWNRCKHVYLHFICLFSPIFVRPVIKESKKCNEIHHRIWMTMENTSALVE